MKKNVVFIVSAILLVALIALFFKEGVYVAFLLFFIAMVIYSHYNSKYKKEFFEKNILPLFNEKKLNFTSEGISEEIAKESKILPIYDEFRSFNTLKGDGFLVSNITLKRHLDEDESDMIYHFLLGIIDFKELKKPFFIKNNTFHLCELLPVCVEKNRQKLDNSHFEKNFDVYGGDLVEVREILTHDVMERLVFFKNKLNIKEIALHNKKAYVIFEKLGFLNPSFLKKDDYKKEIDLFLKFVNFIKGLK